MTKRIDKEKELEVCSLYSYGYNVADINKKTGISISSIHRILKRVLGIAKVPRNMISTPLHVRKEIVELYNKGFSTVNIQIMYKDYIKSDHTVSNILKEEGVEVGTRGTKSIINNENYFENIDNENKAYLLGFLMADGCVTFDSRGSRELNILSLTLQEQDGYIVQMLLDELGCMKKVCNTETKEVKILPKKAIYVEDKKMYSCGITSDKIVSDLNAYGIVRNKTGKEIIPELSECYKIHFIRGFFDGDGIVAYKNKRINNEIRVGFCGSYGMMKSVHDYLKLKINISDNKISYNKSNGIYYLSYSKKDDIYNFYNLIYSNANVYLKRKHDKILNQISEYDGTEIT